MGLPENQRGALCDVCARYGNDRNRLLDVLEDVQRMEGFVAPQAVDVIASCLGLNRVDVEATASFYSFLSRPKPARFVIRLCDDIMDRLRGADRVRRAVCSELGIDVGQTTADARFGLERVSCIGMSDQAPSALVDETVLTGLTADSARQIIRVLRETGSLAALRLPHGDGNNSHLLVHSMVRNNLRQSGPVIFSPFISGTALRKALAQTPIEVNRTMKLARLRGRGGAGFPTGIKWELARASAGERRFVVGNADEGEPGTFKDRVILTEAPDLMFEGMTIAGYALGAAESILYLRGEYAYLHAFLLHTLQERRNHGLLGRDILGKRGFDFDIRIQLGAGAYICGEETALLSSCEGRRGDPRNRPPFPVARGFLGQPTAVNNIETLCCVARIMEHSAAWFAEIGGQNCTGYKLFSVSGDCDRPGVYELPFGTQLSTLLRKAGGADAAAVQVGGAAGQMIGPSEFDRRLCYDDLNTGGAVMIFGQGRDIVEITHAFMEFFSEESCGYCVPCRVGTRLLRERLGRFVAGRAQAGDVEYLDDLARVLKTASRCGLGQSAPNIVLSTLERFRPEYDRHMHAQEPGVLGAFDLNQAVSESLDLTGRRPPGAGPTAPQQGGL